MLPTLHEYDPKELQAWKDLIAPGAPDHIIKLVLHRCAMLGCDPGAKMIYAVNRKKGGKGGPPCLQCKKPLRKGDTNWYCWRKKDGCGATYPLDDKRILDAKPVENTDAEDQWVLQSSIDFFRATAESTDGYAGQEGPYWCGSDGVWRDVWLEKDPPAAAKVGILRNSFAQPLYAVARFDEYKQGEMWDRMGALMIAKCAEALGIRRAFPSKLSGIYIHEEMDQAEREAPTVEKQVEALPTASVAPTVAGQGSAKEWDDTLEVAKKCGKLKAAVLLDLQKIGGDVLALKAQYENALAAKNPRGAVNGNVPASVQSTEAVAEAPLEHDAPARIESASHNAPAVDGEAGIDDECLDEIYEDMGPNGETIFEPSARPSANVVPLMEMFLRPDVQDYYARFEDQMVLCSEFIGRTVQQYSEMTAEDCALALQKLKELFPGEPPKNEDKKKSLLQQLQIELKDAQFVAVLKKSKAYEAATAANASQSEALREARLAWAAYTLKLSSALDSFNDLDDKQIELLLANRKKK